MERIKLQPLKPVLQLTYPKTRPEKNESNYRESLTVTKLVKPRQEWDKARNSVALDLFHARQELHISEVELEKVKTNAKTQFKECDDKWKELETKQKAFRRNFIKFDRFVKENQDKRERAIKKLNDEHELGLQYDEMYMDLKAKYKTLLEAKSTFDTQLKKYTMYDEFLFGVQVLVPTFKEPEDIMLRHENLLEMKAEILKRRNKDFDELDGLKAKHSKMVDEHMLNVLSQNSRIVDLICRHEAARNKALMWETVVAKIRQQAEVKIAEMDSVKFGLWDLYNIMCNRRQEPLEIDRDNFEEQAMYVKKTLWTLDKIHGVLIKKAQDSTTKGNASSRKKAGRKTKISLEIN